jgi:hypothetical protein
VLDTHCNYFAPDDTQNVIVAMQHSFEIYVTRCCSKLHPDHCPPLIRPDGLPPTPDDEQCLEPAGADGRPLNVPKQFILLQRDDSTLPTGPPLKVHPIPGEYVHVHVGSGAGGFISVGQDEAIVPGGIPFP